MDANDFKYQNDQNFCNSLKTLFISAIVLSVLTIFGTFITMIGVFANLPNLNDPDAMIGWVAITSALGLIISVPTGIASFIITLVYAIKLLSHHFDHPDLNQQKLIWGILTLVLLGFIAMIVWTCISKSVLEKARHLEASDKTSLTQQD